MLLIDVVITWVKSGDSGWLKEKELIKKKEKELIKNKLIEDSKSRYPPTTGNENDYETELYYTMLSCVLYLPFIRKIVLVTARPHVPTFILDFGPLVKVVHHDEFIPLTKLYGYPKPLLSNKKVRTYLTHGAPSLPVQVLYFNSVKLRLVMGVYSFVFGWFKTKTRQFWSVPFVSQEKRESYLKRVEKDIKNDLKK